MKQTHVVLTKELHRWLVQRAALNKIEGKELDSMSKIIRTAIGEYKEKVGG